jgi:hypothetical protein
MKKQCLNSPMGILFNFKGRMAPVWEEFADVLRLTTVKKQTDNMSIKTVLLLILAILAVSSQVLAANSGLPSV